MLCIFMFIFVFTFISIFILIFIFIFIVIFSYLLIYIYIYINTYWPLLGSLRNSQAAGALPQTADGQRVDCRSHGFDLWPRS